jgi:hypothetical protein
VKSLQSTCTCIIFSNIDFCHSFNWKPGKYLAFLFSRSRTWDRWYNNDIYYKNKWISSDKLNTGPRFEFCDEFQLWFLLGNIEMLKQHCGKFKTAASQTTFTWQMVFCQIEL